MTILSASRRMGDGLASRRNGPTRASPLTCAGSCAAARYTKVQRSRELHRRHGLGTDAEGNGQSSLPFPG